MDIILLVIIGMTICTQGGIGRVAATGQWTHPLSIIGYILGGLILLITLGSLRRLETSVHRERPAGFARHRHSRSLKVVNAVTHYPELLAHGAAMTAKAGLSDRIMFRQGDVSQLPFDDNSFDWIWSADCIGYPAGELAPVLKELIRVVKPGGSVILLGWSSQNLLPGHPLLEARLNGTCSGYLPFLKDKKPEHNFMRASHGLQDAGMKDVQAQTFVSDIQVPFDDSQRIALASLFDMLWGTRQPDVSDDDWSEYQRLCDPSSADFILDIPKYYGFFTYSVFRGEVDKNLASSTA
jgi:SAM-dependent methyltransferase